MEMKLAAKPHKKERRTKKREEEARQPRPDLSPEIAPLDTPSLAYFDTWYRYSLQVGFEHRVEQNLRARIQKPDLRGSILDLTICQQLYALEVVNLKFLHVTALKMCDAALAPDAYAPEFPRPSHTIWFQPLAPLLYRGEQIIGIFLHRPFDLVFFEQNHYFQTFSHKTRAWWRDFLASEADVVTIDIVTTLPVANETERISTHKFAEYREGSWRRFAIREDCPTGSCTIEEPAEGTELRILCADCAKELDRWSRWLTTILWIANGKLRKPHDTRPNAVYTESVEQRTLLSPQKRRKVYTGEIIKYDASYFRSKPQYHRGPLAASHQIVTPQEAASLEVDEAHILVPDFTDVHDHKRTLRDKKYYPEGRVPAREEDLRRIDVRGKKDKRQLISLALWKAREARRALQRKQHLIYASSYREQ